MALCQNEAKATEAIREARVPCGAALREAESCCMDPAHIIQQSHSDNMQHLEREAIEEEEKDHQSFLSACGMALQVCPLKAQEVLICHLQMLMGNMSLATLLAIPPRHQPSGRNPPLWFPIQPPWWHLYPPQGPNNDTICSIRWCLCHSQETKLPGFWKSHPTRNGRMRCLLRNPLKGSARSLHQRLRFSVAG